MPAVFFKSLNAFSKLIDSLQTVIAQTVKWLVLAMSITVCIIIVARFFDIGSTALQESVTYMHGTLFMLCLAYTAYADGHVRVDICYRRFSLVNRAWVDLIGACLFLLPFSLFLIIVTWHSAVQSWAIGESSINPGGLPFVFLLKSLPPLAGILLCLHALSDICKQLTLVSLQQQDS